MDKAMNEARNKARNVAQDILQNLTTERYKEKLLTLPWKIESQKQKIREFRDAHAEKEQARALKEAEIVEIINAETNPDTGKPLYSNDKAREAAKLCRMGTDQEYQQLAREVKEAKMVMNEAQDQLEQLQDEFKSFQVLAEVVASEVALYAKIMPATLVRQESLAEINLAETKPLKQAQAY